MTHPTNDEETRLPGAPPSRLQATRETLARAASWQAERLRETVDYGVRHPGQLSLVAFGAGLGVGALLMSTARPRRRRSLLPALLCSLYSASRRVFPR